LEYQVRKWALTSDRIYVVPGGVLTSNKGKSKSLAIRGVIRKHVIITLSEIKTQARATRK
jgi:hypothetical protein